MRSLFSRANEHPTGPGKSMCKHMCGWSQQELRAQGKNQIHKNYWWVVHMLYSLKLTLGGLDSKSLTSKNF